MPGFFNTVVSAIRTRAPFASSTGHRNAERTNAVTEVITASLQEFSPAAIIPTKFAQVAVSAYSFFRTDTYVSEKVMHFLQAGISAAQMGLAITLLFQGTQCAAFDSTDLCKSIFLCQLLYRGTLLVGWVPSEFSKDPYTPAENTPQAHV